MSNREYKSDVFSMLLSEKENALAVYNALNGSHYEDPELVEYQMLKKGVSLTIRNDASFILDGSLALFEHQSTVCKNMPLRFLFYISNILEELTKDKNVYGYKEILIPEPKFVVFYNGTKDQPEKQELRLSSSFTKQTGEPNLEVCCTVYNINYGKNNAFLEQCDVLKEYSLFVEKVRSYVDKYKDSDYNKNDIYEMAIDSCIEEGILADFLRKKKGEVLKMMLIDETFERKIELAEMEAREEGRLEGRLEGREEGRLKMIDMIKHLMSSLNCSAEEAMDKVGIQGEEREQLLKKMMK